MPTSIFRENPESLAIDVRDWLVSSIQEHCRATDSPYVISLSGGSTPKRLYALLAELPTGDVSWDRVVLCWGDERNVDPDHADSNFRMVREALLDRIDIPADNVLAVPNPGADAAQAAAAYEQLLRERIALDSNGLPILDCVLLGMGDDVHTAFVVSRFFRIEGAKQNRL